MFSKVKIRPKKNMAESQDYKVRLSKGGIDRIVSVKMLELPQKGGGDVWPLQRFLVDMT